jgi:hypothetical protein
MKFKFFLLIFVCVFVPVFAVSQTDRDEWGLKGRVMYVEQYETDFCCSPNAREKGPRLLRDVTSFDRKGNLTELVNITNGGDGAYYERRVYKYGRDGRKTDVEVYKSEKNPPHTFFAFVPTGDGKVKLMPERAEKLTQRIFFNHDARGRLIEEETRDLNENVVQRRLFRYDAVGNIVRSTALKQGEVIDSDAIVVNFDDGGSETTTIRPGMEVQRSILERDANGRITRDETFGLRPDGDKNPRYVLLARSVHAYSGECERQMDWIFYKPDGSSPNRKIVILRDEHGGETSRTEYDAGPLPVGSRNEGIEPEWTVTRRTLMRREYDKRANEVRTEWREQCAPDLPLELTTIYEQVITYR